MSKKIFLTDIDNACLDWSKPVLEYIARKFGISHFEYDSYTYGIDQQEFDIMVRDFNDNEAFKHLPPYKDAKQIIQKLHDELGFKFVGITTCLTNADPKAQAIIKQRRTENLQEVFGNAFIDCVCLPVHTSKSAAQSLYEPSYYVDDKLRHVETASLLGHKGFWIKHPYNNLELNTDPNITAVDTWQEIYDIIVKK